MGGRGWDDNDDPWAKIGCGKCGINRVETAWNQLRGINRVESIAWNQSRGINRVESIA